MDIRTSITQICVELGEMDIRTSIKANLHLRVILAAIVGEPNQQWMTSKTSYTSILVQTVAFSY